MMIQPVPSGSGAARAERGGDTAPTACPLRAVAQAAQPGCPERRSSGGRRCRPSPKGSHAPLGNGDPGIMHPCERLGPWPLTPRFGSAVVRHLSRLERPAGHASEMCCSRSGGRRATIADPVRSAVEHRVLTSPGERRIVES